MPMGHGANYADTVDSSFFMQHCLDEWHALDDLRRECNLDWQELHVIVRDGFELAADAKFKEAYENLEAACEAETGVVPHLGYHSVDDEGDCYDEIDGEYWHMEGVWQKTPAGEKYEKDIERKFFVTFR